MEEIRTQFDNRKQQGNAEERWEELKKAVIDSAEQHLGRKKRLRKPWISLETLKLVETKHKAFVDWQEERTDMARRKEYVAQCKQVKWAVKCDREQWLVGQLTEMENDLKCNRQGDKKMKRLSGNKVTPADTILDESGQPLQRNEETLARWRRHFERVLNVDNLVSEEVMSGIMDNADVETPDVTKEEVEKAMMKLKNGKAAGNGNIDRSGTPEERRRGNGRLGDRIGARSVEDKESATGVEGCDACASF